MSEENSPMHMPTVKKELNVNTIVSVSGFAITLIVMIAGWASTAATFKANVDEMGRKYDAWIANHEQYHKDRLAEVSANAARTDQRFMALEASARKLENLEYRITVQEQGAANLARNLEELKSAVNSQSADIRVIREILTRLDPRSPN